MRNALLLVFGLAVGIGCAGGGGGDDDDGASPTPGFCDSAWQVNDPQLSLQFGSGAQPEAVGSASASGGTLTLSLDGTLSPSRDAVVYAKRRVPAGDFVAMVHLDSFASSTTGLGVFFGVMRESSSNYYGGRVVLEKVIPPSGVTYRVTAYAIDGIAGNSAGRGFNETPEGLWRIRHEGGRIIVNGTGAPGFSATESIDAGAQQLYVGFGIQNYSLAPLTAQVTAVFSNLTVTTTSGENCFSTGLQ